jgi:hypothetical protein
MAVTFPPILIFISVTFFAIKGALDEFFSIERDCGFQILEGL